MAIERKSDLRIAELLFNDGALVSIQLNYFERLEENGEVVPGTFNNRTVPIDPSTEDGDKVIKWIGAQVHAGLEAKDKALAEAYAELNDLRAKLTVHDDLQLKLNVTTAELTSLRGKLAALNIAE